jgi:hypothetical protein
MLDDNGKREGKRRALARLRLDPDFAAVHWAQRTTPRQIGASNSNPDPASAARWVSVLRNNLEQDRFRKRSPNERHKNQTVLKNNQRKSDAGRQEKRRRQAEGGVK